MSLLEARGDKQAFEQALRDRIKAIWSETPNERVTLPTLRAEINATKLTPQDAWADHVFVDNGNQYLLLGDRSIQASIKLTRRGYLAGPLNKLDELTLQAVVIASRNNAHQVDYFKHEWRNAQAIARLQLQGFLAGVVHPEAFIARNSNRKAYEGIAYRFIGTIAGQLRSPSSNIESNLVTRLGHIITAGRTLLEMHKHQWLHGDISHHQVFVGERKLPHEQITPYAIVGDLGSCVNLSSVMTLQDPRGRQNTQDEQFFVSETDELGNQYMGGYNPRYYGYKDYVVAHLKQHQYPYPFSSAEAIAIENVAFVRSLVDLLTVPWTTQAYWTPPSSDFDWMIEKDHVSKQAWDTFLGRHKQLANDTQPLFKELWQITHDFLSATADHGDSALQNYLETISHLHQKMVVGTSKST